MLRARKAFRGEIGGEHPAFCGAPRVQALYHPTALTEFHDATGKGTCDTERARGALGVESEQTRRRSRRPKHAVRARR